MTAVQIATVLFNVMTNHVKPREAPHAMPSWVILYRISYEDPKMVKQI